MKLTILFAAFILFSLNSFSQETIISGTVTDQKTGEPLAGATVKLISNGQEVITDFDGNFSFSNAEEGMNQILISYISYENTRLNRIVVKVGETATLSIKMKRLETKLKQTFLADNSDSNSSS